MNKWMASALAAAAVAALLAAVACSKESGEATPAPVSDSRPGGIEGIVAGPDGRPLAPLKTAPRFD